MTRRPRDDAPPSMEIIIARALDKACGTGTANEQQRTEQRYIIEMVLGRAAWDLGDGATGEDLETTGDALRLLSKVSTLFKHLPEMDRLRSFEQEQEERRTAARERDDLRDRPSRRRADRGDGRAVAVVEEARDAQS